MRIKVYTLLETSSDDVEVKVFSDFYDLKHAIHSNKEYDYAHDDMGGDMEKAFEEWDECEPLSAWNDAAIVYTVQRHYI